MCKYSSKSKLFFTVQSLLLVATSTTCSAFSATAPTALKSSRHHFASASSEFWQPITPIYPSPAAPSVTMIPSPPKQITPPKFRNTKEKTSSSPIVSLGELLEPTEYSVTPLPPTQRALTSVLQDWTSEEQVHTVLREGTAIAASCLIAGAIVYTTVCDMGLVKDFFYFLCHCVRNCGSRSLFFLRGHAKTTLCLHALRDVALVCSAMTMTGWKPPSVSAVVANKLLASSSQQDDTILSLKSGITADNGSDDPFFDQEDEDEDLEGVVSTVVSSLSNEDLPLLSRVKTATLCLLPVLDILLSGIVLCPKTWNEFLYFLMVSASTVDGFRLPKEAIMANAKTAAAEVSSVLLRHQQELKQRMQFRGSKTLLSQAAMA